MSSLVTMLACASAVAYALMTIQMLRGAWVPYAGSRPLNIAAVATFALSRLASNNLIFDALASAVLASALALITRRSSAAGAIFAALPLLEMLLTVDRIFFSADVANSFQNATIALLCAGGPAALVCYLMTTRKVRVP